MALLTAISGHVSDLGSTVRAGNSEEPAATAAAGYLKPPVIVSTVPGILARHQAEAMATAVPGTTPAPSVEDTTTATTPPAPVSASFTYTIQPGDTIESIAAAFGLNPAYILWSNTEVSSDPNLLLIGETLVIPGTDGIVYHVVEGDTLSGIAAYYGIDMSAITGFAGNNLSTPESLITDGMVLVLPGAVPPPEPEPVYVAETPVEDEPSAPVFAGAAAAAASVPAPSYGYVWPVYGNITTYFMEGGHKGIDIDGFGQYGAPIGAAAGGTVILASWSDWGLGYQVIVDHGDGMQTVYGHLSEIWVTQGQYVNQGEAVGALGSTGYSTGPHLHFEMHYYGGLVDPLAYLP